MLPAANWRYVGLTRGYGKRGGSWQHHGQPKAMYVYPLRADAPEILSGTLLPADFAAFDREMQ